MITGRKKHEEKHVTGPLIRSGDTFDNYHVY